MRRQRHDPAGAGAEERGSDDAGAGRGGRQRLHRRQASCGALLLLTVALHAVVLSRATSHAANPAVMSGQLTWEIDRRFAHPLSPQRRVTFTLLTAFEMDPRCDYSGSQVDCSASLAAEQALGFLCVDQYKIRPGFIPSPPPDSSFTPEIQDAPCDPEAQEGPHTGKKNMFQIVSTRHINGLNIVFGKLVHTVVARNDTIAMIGYFRGRGDRATAVLPQCQINITDTALPCAMNVDDLDNPESPLYRFRKIAGFSGDDFNEKEPYWRDFASSYQTPPPQQAPLFEIYVRVCPKDGYQRCDGDEVGSVSFLRVFPVCGKTRRAEVSAMRCALSGCTSSNNKFQPSI